MAVTPRILRSNLVLAPASVLTAPGADIAFPVANLKDQARGKRVRSKVGWTVDGSNDALPFATADGGRLGYIAHADYSTPAAYATAVQAAFAAAGYNPITGMTGLKLWLRADAVTLDANGLVQTATDLSGNGNHATQAVAAQRPLWLPNAIDGRPGLYFGGIANMNLATSVNMSALLGTNGVGTIIVVARLDSDAAANDILWHAGSGTQFAWMIWTGTTNFAAVAFDSASRTATDAAAVGPSTVHSLWWKYDQTNLAGSVDNANSAGFTNTAMTGAMHANILGSTFKLGNTGADLLKGTIYQCLVFNRALAEFERQGIVANLKAWQPSLVDNSTAVGWSVTIGETYDGVAKKFTTARTAGAGNISLLGSTGVPAQDKAAAAYPGLGYTAGTDKTAATSYVSDTAVYQGRHFFYMDAGAPVAVTAAVVLDHNAGVGGTFTLEANGSDSWNAPAFSVVLTGDAAQRSAYFASQSFRYWRLVVDDVQNVAGYSEIGVWYLGTYDQPPDYSPRFSRTWDDLSTWQRAGFGAGHGTERPQAGVWNVHWRNVLDSQKVALEAFQEATPRSKSFFFLFDAAVPTSLRYVNRPDPLSFQHNERSVMLWEVEAAFVEALP